MKKKMPAIMFYTADWLEDQAVQVCSLAAQGLWINLLCYMNKSPRRGVLLLNEDTPMTSLHIARLVGVEVSECESLLQELVTSGVPSVEDTPNGAAYVSRRMLKDEEKRAKCSHAGKKGGGNPNWKPGVKGPSIPSGDTTVTVPDTDTSAKMYTNSSSENYHYARLTGVELVWGAIPPDRRRSPQRSKVAIGKAIERISAPSGPTPEQLAELCAKAEEYYNSPEGRSKYFRSPNTFFDEGGWMEDPAVWASREETAEQGERM